MFINYRDLLTHLGKPFSSGLDRQAYYSEKYDVVVKQRRPGRSRHNVDQIKSETQVFLHMTDEDFDVFPIIAVVSFLDQDFIVMERCKILKSLTTEEYVSYKRAENQQTRKKMEDFINRFEIVDLHNENMAIRKNGNLCVIDAGFNIFSEFPERAHHFTRNDREIIKLRRIPY